MIRRNMTRLKLEVKEAKRTMQILMQVPDTADYDEAEKLLSKATEILKS
jgi:hypothetical protein